MHHTFISDSIKIKYNVYHLVFILGGLMKTISQSGCSMVEMLGTLAIIGVLSIGGVAGYSYAINKHYANELIYDIDILSNEISRYIMVHNPGILPDDLA